MYNYMAWYKVFCRSDKCDFFGVIILKYVLEQYIIL